VQSVLESTPGISRRAACAPTPPLSPSAQFRAEKLPSSSPSDALKLEEYVVAQAAKYRQAAHPTIDEFQGE